ncbi:cytochrome C oxidase subunit IV family protein [Buchnera aphidicola (Mollitrichosiphum nigrofasciatum)]|uniref:cytochrome o ubiquinol oxidase subunit IV n=1 Tax=Buchnera aphidicola TaxID=9 RepID=UPI0031B8147B
MKNNIKKNNSILDFDKCIFFDNFFYGYCIGFCISLFLTIISFLIVFLNLFSNVLTIIVLSCLLIIQVFAQIKYFLHLNIMNKNYWHMFALVFVLIIISILFVGTIWIMYHLKHNMFVVYIYE